MSTLDLEYEVGSNGINYLFSKLRGNTPVSLHYEHRPGLGNNDYPIPDYNSRDREAEMARIFREEGVCFNKVNGYWEASMVAKNTDGKAEYKTIRHYGSDLMKKGIHLVSLVKFGRIVQIATQGR